MIIEGREKGDLLSIIKGYEFSLLAVEHESLFHTAQGIEGKTGQAPLLLNADFHGTQKQHLT